MVRHRQNITKCNTAGNTERKELTPSLIRQIVKDAMYEMKSDIKADINTVKEEIEEIKGNLDLYVTQSDKAINIASETAEN